MNILVFILIAFFALATGFLGGILNERRKWGKKLDEQRFNQSATEYELRSVREKLAAAHEDAERQRQADAALARQREETLRKEFQNLAEKVSREQGKNLQDTNREQMNALLEPLDRHIRDFRDKFASTRESLEKQIESLLRQTGRVSDEANELARALRNETKTQGNWGEGILQNLLDASGLKEGTDYFLQQDITDANGNHRRPDCIVSLPGEKRLIIDSKVSLTAYIDYANANSDDERKSALRRHLDSVRAHFKELEQKDYPRIVKGAVGYVLMFIPNEGAYVAAVQNDQRLISDAYNKQIIMVNPTNLLMALQLALNLWKSERRKQNVEAIYKSAEALYKKFTTFAAGYVDMGRQIEKLQNSYETTRGQLCTGRGNIIRQLEGWKEKGLETNARIPDNLIDEEQASEDGALNALPNDSRPES